MVEGWKTRCRHVKSKKVKLDVNPGFNPCQSSHVAAAPSYLALATPDANAFVRQPSSSFLQSTTPRLAQDPFSILKSRHRCEDDCMRAILASEK